MKYVGYSGTVLMIVAGFCGLNEILYLASSYFGLPTTIAGLDWALDHAVFGSPVFQVAGTAAGFAISFLFDPNNETAAAYRTGRAKAEALEKIERIGDGARVTVGSSLRARKARPRVGIGPPRPLPAIGGEAQKKHTA